MCCFLLPFHVLFRLRVKSLRGEAEAEVRVSEVRVLRDEAEVEVRVLKLEF